MKQKHLLLALLFGISPAAHAEVPEIDATKFEQSPFAACKEVGLITKSDYQKNKAFWDDARDRCGVQVQVLSSDGFMDSFMKFVGNKPRTAEEKQKTIKFLTDVGARAKNQVELNVRVNKFSAACAKGDDKAIAAAAALAANDVEKAIMDPARCKDLIKDAKSVAEEFGPKARVQNALLHKLASVLGAATNAVQSGLNFDTDLEKAELSRSEEKQVKERLAAMDAKIQAEEDQLPKAMKFDPEGLAAARQSILEKYRKEELEKVTKEFQETMAQAPMVTFIKGSGSVSDKDLAYAFDQVVDHAEKTSLDVSKHLLQADKAVGAEKKIGRLEELFTKYGPMVEAQLKQDPSMCGIATNYAKHLGYRDTAITVGKLGAVIGGSLLTGGVAGAFGTAVSGAAAGAAASATAGFAAAGAISLPAFYWPDKKAYELAEMRAHANAHTVDGKLGKGENLTEYKQFQEARDAYVMDLAMSPTELLGAPVGVAGKGLVNLVRRPAVMKAAQEALVKSGETAENAARIVREIRSTDGAVSARAVNKVASALDVDTKEVKVLRNLYRTNVVRSGDEKAMNRALEKLREIPAGERPAVYAKIDEALANINPAKINAGNRDQVLDTVVAGMQSVGDPKRVAALVTDWETGLDGLSATFQRAKEHMNSKELSSLSGEARERAAFQKGLDDMREVNPDLKKMPDDAWKKMREEMTTCPMGPVKKAA